MVFIIFFIVDTVAITSNGFDVSDKLQLSSRIICMIIMSINFIYEFVDLRINFHTYLRNVWNSNDLFAFLAYLTFFVLSFVAEDKVYALKSLQMVITITSFIKLCFLIRIFTKLAFLVRMLTNVFYDLRYFLIFFFVLIFLAGIYQLLGIHAKRIFI